MMDFISWRMTAVFFACVLISPMKDVFGAFDRSSIGARQDALGGAFAAVSDDEYSAFYNPAGLASLTGKIISFSYSIPYSMKELQRYSGVIALPLGKQSFAVSWSYSGFALYREELAQISTGISLGRRVFFGGTIKYFHLSVSRYGSAGYPDGDCGFLARLSDAWMVGGFLANGVSHKAGSLSIAPRAFAFGISRRFASHGFLTAECEKDSSERFFPAYGAEWNFENMLRLRIGYRTREDSLSAGIGVGLRRYSVDYAIVHHADLGMVHSMTMAISMR